MFFILVCGKKKDGYKNIKMAAKKIQSLLFSGCAALSCAVSYVGHQKEKQVKMKMRQLLQSAVTEEDFNKIATGQQRLMQLQVQTECGEVNVSKQEFQTRVKNETLLLTETFQLESQHFKTSARFASCLRFVSDKTFGSSRLIPATDDVCFTPAFPITKNVLHHGCEMQRFVMSEHPGVNPTFKPSDLYRYDYSSFKGQSLFALGTRVGSKFAYSQVGTSPQTVVSQSFANDEILAFTMKYGGACVAVACAAGAIDSAVSN